MKIYRIHVGNEFRPNHQDFVWPPQNSQAGGDMGVEQDFDNWLLEHHNYLVDNPSRADWIYLPIFWNRYYINNDWGDSGQEALKNEVERHLSYKAPVFTISEADIKCLKPYINWGNITIFCSSRRDNNGSIDIPLLCAPHNISNSIPPKRYICSFMGNLRTDGIRMGMAEALAHRVDCKVEHSNVPPDEFARVMMQSYIALCPRGQGAQSYRMYEAMQMGVVPMYISDMDCRPFKKWLDWDIFSLYSPTPYVDEFIDVLKENLNVLLAMGERAKEIYEEQLNYGKWCKYVIRELESL